MACSLAICLCLFNTTFDLCQMKGHQDQTWNTNLLIICKSFFSCYAFWQPYQQSSSFDILLCLSIIFYYLPRISHRPKQLQSYLQLMSIKDNLSYVIKSDLSSIVEPIFQTVRKNKINSFSQFKNFQSKSVEKSYIFQPLKVAEKLIEERANKTYSFGFPIATSIGKQKRYLTTARSKAQQNPEDINNFIENSQTLQNRRLVRQQRQSGIQKQKRSPILKISSKVKKHLVEKIDFDEIEKHLYKERQCITRYSHFMSLRLKQKKPISQSLSLRNQMVSDKNGKMDKKVQGKIFDKLKFDLQSSCDNPFALRVVANKKFWRKCPNSCRERKNGQENEKQPKCVEGKSLSTIQT